MGNKYKISFCTVSMNRLYHVQQTLLRNIRDNLQYEDLEFVILDYNSKDNLAKWIMNEGREYLERGVLKYFKATEPEIFDRSHSRNMCFRLATGDVICNVDADNFIGTGFAHYINDAFQREPNIFLTGEAFMRDAIGRFCIRKEDFVSINGYNEKIKGYGFEDLELYDRLTMAGKEQRNINEVRFLNIIHHSSFERIANEKLNRGLKKVFVAYHTTYESDLILLYDNTALKARLINYADVIRGKTSVVKGLSSSKAFSLREPLQEAITFNKGGDVLCEFTGTSGSQQISYAQYPENELIDAANGIRFYEITDDSYRDDIILLLSELANKQIMFKYLTAHEKVNETGFGKGVIYSWDNTEYNLA